MAEPSWWSPELTAWVDLVDARWRAFGLGDDVRSRLRHDLVTDLGRALLGGASADELSSAEPARFADDVAAAAGIEPTAFVLPAPRRVTQVDRTHVVLVALAGAFVGGLLSLLTVYPIGIRIIDNASMSYTVQGDVALAVHATASLLAATCAGLAVRRYFRHCPNPGRLALGSSVALLVSGAGAALVTVAFARTTDYSSRTPVVAIEMLLVVLVCTCGLMMAMRLLRLDRSR